MKKLLVLSLAFFSLNAEVLRVGTSPNFAPYEYIEDGILKGFDVDVMSEVAKRMNIDIEYKYMDFDGLIPSLKSNKIDLISAMMKKTPLRQRAVDFSIGIKSSANYFLTHSTFANIPSGIKECKSYDLASYKFGAELGSVQFDFAKKSSSKVNGYSNINIALLALDSKKLDFVVVDKAASIKFMQKNPNLKIYCEYLDDSGEGFVVNKGNKALLDRLNAALKQMHDDGTIASIAKKYGI